MRPRQARTTLSVALVTPGAFQVNLSGLAAAVIVTVERNGSQTLGSVYQLDSANRVISLPIDLNTGRFTRHCTNRDSERHSSDLRGGRAKRAGTFCRRAVRVSAPRPSQRRPFTAGAEGQRSGKYRHHCRWPRNQYRPGHIRIVSVLGPSDRFTAVSEDVWERNVALLTRR
jgi:hypothetical protein